MLLGRHFAVTASLSLLLFLSACGDDTPPGDAGGDTGGDAADTGPPPMCDMSTVPPLMEGDPDGHPEPLGAGPGEARAGRVTEADLPVNPGGLETWDAGDYLLANDHVAVLIEQAGVSQLYDPWGGALVGIFAVEDGALTRAGDFNEILLRRRSLRHQPDLRHGPRRR